jgi:hypothetical protein
MAQFGGEGNSFHYWIVSVPLKNVMVKLQLFAEVSP